MKATGTLIGTHRARGQQGSILVLTMFFLILLSFFAIAFWKLIPVELHSANRHKMDTAAYYAADAGVADTMLWLGERTRQGNVDEEFEDGAIERSGELADWNWTVTLTPGPDTYGAPGVTSPNPIRCYHIESVASKGTQNYRKVSVWSVQRSFAEYGWYFERFANQSELWLNLATFRLDGRYHTNEQLLLYTTGSGFSWAGDSSFQDLATFGERTNNPTLGDVDGIRYSSWSAANIPYNGSGAAVPGRYERISAQGALGLQSTDSIEMPESSDDVARGAWGDTPPDTALAPAGSFFGSGVNARINGATAGSDANAGLYIEGDVDQIEFSVRNSAGGAIAAVGPDAPAGNQNVRIKQGNNIIGVTFVTETMTLPAGSVVNGTAIGAAQTLNGTDNTNNGHTVVERLNSSGNPLTPRQFVRYNKQSNGVIYTTGTINGIRGTVKGRRTVATRTDSGASTSEDEVIRINGELLYAGTSRGDDPVSTRDQLGLISYAVRMKNTQHTSGVTAPTINEGGMFPRRNQTNSNNPHLLYCSIFAGRNGDPNANLSGGQGMIVGGGFGVESSANTDSGLGVGTMHLFGSLSEGVRQRKGTIDTAGYNYQNVYDTNLRVAQPPFFPSLPEYRVALWREESFFAY